MAQINTTFSFRDQMSHGLMSLNHTMERMCETLSSMQRGMRGVEEDTKKTADGMGGLAVNLLNFNAAVDAFNHVRGAIGTVIEAVGELNGMYQAQMDAEARLSAVMQARFHSNAEGIADMTRYLDDFSKGSAYNKTMLTNAAQELGTYIESAETLKGLLPMLTSMSQQAGIANEQGLMSMATMIGKVMGGDMGGLSKRGWQFSDEEKQAFKTMNEMERLNFLVNTAKENIGEQDQAIADMMANLAQQRNLENLQIKMGGIFGGLLDSIGLVEIKLKTFFYEKMIPIAESVMPYVQAIGDGMIAGLDKAFAAFDDFSSKIGRFVKFLSENMNKVIVVIGGVAAAVVTVAAAYAVLHAAQIKSIALSIKEAAVKVAGAIAANAALFLVVAGVLALIAVLVLLLVNAEKTFPAIGGFIGGIGACAKEVGAQIKYHFGSAIEWVVNGFLTLRKNVADVFWNLIDFLLSGLEKVAGALDSVFGTNIGKNIQAFRNGIEQFINSDAGKFSLGWSDERRGFAEAWAEGSRAGEQVGGELAGKLNEGLDKFTAMIKGKFGGLGAEGMNLSKKIEEGIGNSFEFGSGGDLSVSDKNMVSIADDYRDLLSKRATERFNLQYKNVTPSVNISTMNISNGMDKDEMINEIALGIKDMANSSLGVA